jgi:plastocyanin
MPHVRAALLLPALVVVVALIPVADGAAAAPHRPAVSRLVADTYVDAVDNRFEPTVPRVPRGGQVVFDFVGPVEHHAAADSLLRLYDSGSVAPGGASTSYTFVAAGVYPFTCVFHIAEGMTGRIHVPMRATPTKGSLKRTYTLTWASAEATVGFSYDVRLKRPDHVWRSWRSAVSVRKATYRPHAGKGVYRFQARLRRSDTGDVSLWSDAVTITVG